jgi:ABC-type transport system involved in cytochrome c biogenesis permease subunit
MDLLLSVYISQIEAFLFQLLVIILLFFVFGRKKITNKIRTAKKPLLVLGCGILIYVIIAVMFRMKDPIDKTLLLEQNISYLLMLKMRYVNFVINLFVLPCLWIIFRKLTLAKK